MKKSDAGNPVPSDALLACARVGIDPCCERGRVCRGAYIVANGTEYMTTSGEWTHGITGDHNWWVDAYSAEAFLKFMRANKVLTGGEQAAGEPYSGANGSEVHHG